MKKTLFILGGIALLCVLLIARLLFQQRNSFIEERAWFAKAVRYEFSAVVDTVWMLNDHAGRLRCLVTEGNPQIEREDSLKRSFKKHDMLYLIYKRSSDSIIFIFPNANQVAKGDSVRVSSQRNSIQFFRAGKLTASDSLSLALTGFGRPFFMKRK